MGDADWGPVRDIYTAGIATGNATFEERAPDKAAFFASRVASLSIVAVDDGGTILGWAAASPVSSRPAYRGVVEHSVYVDPGQAGRGVATSLLRDLITRAREDGYWTLQSAIFAENTASRALHIKAGFREIGRRERIALMNHGSWAGQWRDTILYELRL